jgi:hypothetical protein
MINKKYRHKKTDIEVAYGGSGRYYSTKPGNEVYYIPKEVVEDSTEWEEIVREPIKDFYGSEIKAGEICYAVIKDSSNVTHVVNRVNMHMDQLLEKKAKILANFKVYTEACQYQRVYVSLQKSKDLILTATGNPTKFLKNILKSL